MKERFLSFLLPFVLTIMLLILWQFLADRNLINRALFSSPRDIAFSLFEDSELIFHIFSSLYRLFISVLLGYPLGVLIGAVISRNKEFRFVEDIVSFFMSIPGISWVPIFIIILGFGDRTIISIGVITAFFPALYNMLHGLKAVNKNILRVGDLLEFSSIRKFFQIYIPAASNYLLVGLKESFARTWRTVIAVEMVAATLYGLGYMTFDARELINSSIMFLGIILSGMVYVLIEVLFIGYIERKTVIRWGMKKQH